MINNRLTFLQLTIIFFCLTLLLNTHAQERYVSHYAGMVVSADNLMGYESVAKSPTGIYGDVDGNIYFSDPGNCVIRMIDGTSSQLLTIVGTNLCGHNGDGFPGTSTMLGRVGNIFVDGNGQIFWPETDYGLVRVFNMLGVVETLVGSLSTSSPSDNVPCQDTGLSHPRAVWVDSFGNIYIADTNNYRVRRCNLLGGTIITVAGSALTSDSGDSGPATSAGLSSPNDIHGDTSGNLYIACSASIRFVDGGTGIITTLISGLSNPQGIFYQISSESLFIAESDANVIKKMSSSGIISSIAGTSIQGKSIDSAYPTATYLGRPADVYMDANTMIYFTESLTGYVSAFLQGSRLYHFLGPSSVYGKYVGDGYDATLAFLSQPNQIWGDTMGTLYVADGGNGLIRKITTSNAISSLGNASGAFSFNAPYGVYGDTSNHLYVSDLAASVLYKITLSPTVTRQVYSGQAGNPDCVYNVLASAALLDSPASLWVDEIGKIYLTDMGCGIFVYGLNNLVTRVFGVAGYGITGNGQSLFVANTAANSVLEIDRGTYQPRIIAGDGTASYQQLYGGELATQVSLNEPTAITIDRSGNIYVADTQNFVIRMIYKTGVSGSDYFIRNILGDNEEYIGGTLIDGPAKDVRISKSTGIWASTNGDVYFTSYSNLVQRIYDYISPTSSPTRKPISPTRKPTKLPTYSPTCCPTLLPTLQPSMQPTTQPSSLPSNRPSTAPSSHPSTSHPSRTPTSFPSFQPTFRPSNAPSSIPSLKPSVDPTSQPSSPSTHPPSFPTTQPTGFPSALPSVFPSTAASFLPSSRPTNQPSFRSSSIPSSKPTDQPSGFPSYQPSSSPTTNDPSDLPTSQPTMKPTRAPSSHPSIRVIPSVNPTRSSSDLPTPCPSSFLISSIPSILPSIFPTDRPSASIPPTPCLTLLPTFIPPNHPSLAPTNAFTLLSLFFGQVEIHPKKNDTSILLKAIPNNLKGMPSSTGTISPALTTLTKDVMKVDHGKIVDVKADGLDHQSSSYSESVTSFKSFINTQVSNDTSDDISSGSELSSDGSASTPQGNLNQRSAAILPTMQRSSTLLSFTSLGFGRRRLDTDVSMFSLSGYFGPEDDESDQSNNLVSAEELTENGSIFLSRSAMIPSSNENSESTVSSGVFESQMENWIPSQFNSRRETEIPSIYSSPRSSRLRLRSRGMSNLSLETDRLESSR
eukprot:gene9584-10406_t